MAALIAFWRPPAKEKLPHMIYYIGSKDVEINSAPLSCARTLVAVGNNTLFVKCTACYREITVLSIYIYIDTIKNIYIYIYTYTCDIHFARINATCYMIGVIHIYTHMDGVVADGVLSGHYGITN